MKWIKRIIISIVLLLVLAIATLWILGHRPGAGTFEVSVLIDRPMPVVYAALTNDNMTRKWVSGVINIEKLTPPPTRVGTTIILTEMISGHRVVMREEVTALDPPRLKKYISLGMGEPSTQFTEYGEYELTNEGGKTLFTMRSKLKYHGLLYTLLEPLLTPSVRAKFEGDQKTLKAILEAKPVAKKQ